ncbi:hypothetical protein CR194_03220 [Salipaludibacillus keqinensis]|uniref:Uncharacterized protein n=1 Tax=Salipaludibacillus keqinensis TaxID=2045207 RepID=A0A323TI81_9BACI|nr:hypothetical protein [Salipaludibacillus keqinensis]PYZ94558.1 hypothetical protein CR194_03220 [Salipaludibacillus keqinensis]
MELQTIRKKLEEVAHMSQELKNTYYRLNDNEKKEFKIGYPMDVDVDELAKQLFEWSEIQFERNK